MTRYGRISPDQLAQFERETDNLIVDVTLPIEIVFNKIEDLLDYGDIAQTPYTQLQAVNKGYNIINKTGIYADYIKTWLRRPPNQRTWMNFKTHFQQAFDELNETGQLTLQQTGYRNVNLVDEVVSRVANEVQAQLNSIQETVNPTPAPTLTSNNSTAQHITTDTLIQQLLQQQAINIIEFMAYTRFSISRQFDAVVH